MRFMRLALWAILMTVAVSVTAWADGSAEKAAPKKWRIIYVEGGPYTNYQQLLAGNRPGTGAARLIDNGNVSVPSGTESSREMWEWLSRNAGGSRIEFVRDGYYSSNWDAVERERVREAITNRIRDRKDVDMIFAFGTWSGLGHGPKREGYSRVFHVRIRCRGGGVAMSPGGFRAGQSPCAGGAGPLQKADRRIS